MKTLRLTASLLIFATALAACDQEQSPANTTTQVPKLAAPATTIFTNGDIVTVNDAQPSAEAVAIRAGKILAVGTREAVLAEAGDNIELRDLRGHTLLPGFIDAHGHISYTALNQACQRVLTPGWRS